MTDRSKKNVFIVGGSRGIGASIVRRLSQHHAVTFTFAHSESAAHRLAEETRSQTIKLDVTDRHALVNAVSSQQQLDVLILNAGVFTSSQNNPSPEDIEKMFLVNINAPYFAAIEAAKKMKPGGRILIIGSVNAERLPVPGLAAYGASKAALKGMVKGLARDFGPRGITINVVQPGPTDTDMNPADGPLNEMMHSFMAIKRHIQSDEVAALVAWLAGPETDMITGTALTIDGGYLA